ncbi:8731_t:CDS:2 [Acaulospora morrowiae]|uniref:8731_t:CDS:1 n=1 Tax=Acaulospora morrowiae TaxID=94023 RepID=A0A9N9FC34_9GLOM|nr:8731_t:CDS:2 [Acaulospora morrowiae]
MSEISRLALLDTDLLHIIFDNFKRQDDMFISLLVHPVWTQILIRKLWKEPVWKSPSSYQKFLKTLRSSSPFFPYAEMVRHLNFVPLPYRPHPLFTRKDIRFIADRCKCLTKLRVGWMMDPFDSYTFCKFLVNSPNLASISCPDCTMEWLAKALGPAMSGHCKNLRHLEVKNWVHESGETCALLERVAGNCGGIISLYAHLLVTEEIALMLVKSFPNLKYFRCHSVTSSALLILIRGFQKLKGLHLTLDKDIQDQKNDTELVEIGKKFPLLDSFQLSIGNDKFPPFALTWIQNQHYLQHLELSLCDGLTDDSFISIVKHCSNLESIQLKWCSRLTVLSYKALAQYRNTRLRQLRVLRSGLNDIGLAKIARHCSRLSKLNIDQCPEVTRESLMMIAKNCRKLVKLTGGFSQQTLASLGCSLSSHGPGNLQVLKLRDPSYRGSEKNITSNRNFDHFDGKLLGQLACNYPQLRKLVIRCTINELLPDKLVQIIFSLRNLEELFITPFEPLDVEHIMKLELHPKLKEIMLLGGCSGDAERYIEQHRNGLKMFIKVIKHDYKMYTIK